jgi:uncharacterized membrane protein YbhN (UPF0104 family)
MRLAGRPLDRWRRLPAWAPVALRWALGVGIVAVLLLRQDAGDVLRRLGSADLRLAIPAVIGLVAVQALGALAWWAISRALRGGAMPWGETLRLYYVAQGLGALTPGNLGADVYRVAAGTRDERAPGWRVRLVAIVVQRVTSTLALVCLGLAGFLVLPSAAAPSLPLFLIGALLAIGSAVLIWLISRRRSWLPDQDGSSPPTRRLAEAGGIGLLLGAAFHIVAIGLGGLLVASVTRVTDPLPILGCLAIARLSILLPISPSGLGIQEGALSLLFMQIGLPAETALAAALLNRLALLATAAVGALLLVPTPEKPRLQVGWPTGAGPRPRVR